VVFWGEEKMRFNFLSSIYITLIVISFVRCQSISQTHHSSNDDINTRFKQLAVASVCDAVDQVTGERGFMSHEIKPLFPTKICGPAVTVLSTPSKEKQPPSMALDLVDHAAPGSVLVLVMEGPDGANVAAFGGIMCTGAKARGLEACVIDGGTRDLAEIEEMGFPVFAKGIVPSSSVGRYINVSKNEPVLCGGVMVHPGDLLVGDRDGIVVVPKEHAMEILLLAEELEAKESKTMRDVKRLQSIQKATQLNQRI
jgi:regulator of RNase E activity RraA